VILRIGQLKPHNGSLAIRLFQGLVSEFVGVNAVGLGIVSGSLLVWHVISLKEKAGNLIELIQQSLFLKVEHSANSGLEISYRHWLRTSPPVRQYLSALGERDHES
jgi:hypothetical protein